MKKVLSVIAIIIVVLAVIITLQPSHFKVTRSLNISAKVDQVFPHVNDLRQWEEWSPWTKMDPDAKMSYSGPQAGKDAAMSWDGDNNVGAGTMTITDSVKNESVSFRLDFTRPMAGTSTASFTFKPDGNSTVVTWTMEGDNNFIAKAIGLVLNCDKMIGSQFEQGLNNLQAIISKES